MKKLTEKVLIYRVCASQDSDAFGELYDRYVERIYRFVFFKISHKQDAEDLTSDIFLRVWNYLVQAEESRQVQSFSGLVYRIARNRVIDWYRAKARAQECTIEEVVDAQSGEDIEHALGARQELDELLRAIRTLKQEYQEVILLRHIEELSIAEIAQIMDKKQTAVRVTLHRAMKKLKTTTSDE